MGNTVAWPWEYAGSSTPGAGPEPLWQDLYEVRDRSKTGFEFQTVFNPYVL